MRHLLASALEIAPFLHQNFTQKKQFPFSPCKWLLCCLGNHFHGVGLFGVEIRTVACAISAFPPRKRNHCLGGSPLLCRASSFIEILRNIVDRLFFLCLMVHMHATGPIWCYLVLSGGFLKSSEKYQRDPLSICQHSPEPPEVPGRFLFLGLSGVFYLLAIWCYLVLSGH